MNECVKCGYNHCRCKGFVVPAANKAAEEGGLPALKFDVETSDELTDAQNQSIDNLRTLNELLICFSSWEPQVCVVGNVRAGDAANAVRQAIAADRASRQVANKAEVEPTCVCGSPTTLGSVHRTDGPCYVAEATPPATTGASNAARFGNVWNDALEEAALICDGVNNCTNPMTAGDCADSIRALKSSVGASTVLTDERASIDTDAFHVFMNEYDNEASYGSINKARNNLVAYIDQHVAREVAAQAGQVAVPENMVMMPKEPSHLMIAAMACSKAKDDEGEFSSMLDLLDFSGENKAHAVLKAAYHAAVAAAPSPVKESK